MKKTLLLLCLCLSLLAAEKGVSTFSKSYLAEPNPFFKILKEQDTLQELQKQLEIQKLL